MNFLEKTRNLEKHQKVTFELTFQLKKNQFMAITLVIQNEIVFP